MVAVHALDTNRCQSTVGLYRGGLRDWAAWSGLASQENLSRRFSYADMLDCRGRRSVLPVVKQVFFNTPSCCQNGVSLTANQLRRQAAAIIDSATTLSVSVDGEAIRNLVRVKSVVSAVTVPADNIFGPNACCSGVSLATGSVFAVCRRRILCATGYLERGGAHSSNLRPVGHGCGYCGRHIRPHHRAGSFEIGFVRVAGRRRRLPG